MIEVPENDEEIRTTAAAVLQPPCEAIFNTERASNLDRLVRITAWCQRFMSNARAKVAAWKGKDGIGPKVPTIRSCPLTVSEIHTSSKYWFGVAQRQGFKEEMDRISAGKSLPARSPMIRLYPILVDGILRVGGRIEKAEIP